MIRNIKLLALGICLVSLLTGCSYNEWMRVPPPSVTASPSGEVRATYPNMGHAVGRVIHYSFGPTLHERTRNGGTEVSDGWIEFESNQARTEFILDPGGEVGEAYVKYKDEVIVRRLHSPNWNFYLKNQYNSGTRDYELWFRYEDGSEKLVTIITVVSSPPRSLRSKGQRY